MNLLVIMQQFSAWNLVINFLTLLINWRRFLNSLRASTNRSQLNFSASFRRAYDGMEWWKKNWKERVQLCMQYKNLHAHNKKNQNHYFSCLGSTFSWKYFFFISQQNLMRNSRWEIIDRRLISTILVNLRSW